MYYSEILFNLMRSYILGYTGLFFQETFYMILIIFHNQCLQIVFAPCNQRALSSVLFIPGPHINTFFSIQVLIPTFQHNDAFFSIVSWPLCHQPSRGKPFFKMCFKSRPLRVMPFTFFFFFFANWSVVIYELKNTF